MAAAQQHVVTVFDPATVPDEMRACLLATRLHGAWLRWRADKPMPSRLDIDVFDIPKLLEHIVLLDVLENDFRFRVVGEAVNARYGPGMKGQRLGAMLNGPARNGTLEEHRCCAQERKGVLTRNLGDRVSMHDQLIYTRLLLPVGEPDGTVTHILGVMEFPEPL